MLVFPCFRASLELPDLTCLPGLLGRSLKKPSCNSQSSAEAPSDKGSDFLEAAGMAETAAPAQTNMEVELQEQPGSTDTGMNETSSPESVPATTGMQEASSCPGSASEASAPAGGKPREQSKKSPKRSKAWKEVTSLAFQAAGAAWTEAAEIEVIMKTRTNFLPFIQFLQIA
jgi:hypothetical protein